MWAETYCLEPWVLTWVAGAHGTASLMLLLPSLAKSELAEVHLCESQAYLLTAVVTLPIFFEEAGEFTVALELVCPSFLCEAYLVPITVLMSSW